MREIILSQDDEGDWVAECEELPGVRIKAGTKEAAIEKISKALLLYRPCRCED